MSNCGYQKTEYKKDFCGEDRFKIVELIEVVTHNGKETLRKWQPRKQYIHTDPKIDPDNPHPEYGRCIRLKARIWWLSDTVSKPADGQIVKWTFKPGKKNTKALSGEDQEGFDKKGGSKTKETFTDVEGWTPVVEFYLSDPVDKWKKIIPIKPPGSSKKRLSQYDGDTFEIIATDENDESLSTGVLTVIGITDWLPGINRVPDNDMPRLPARPSIPIGLFIHSGATGRNVAKYLRDEKDRFVSCQFAWSYDEKTGVDEIVQQVPLDLFAWCNGKNANVYWGYEWPGPPVKKLEKVVDDPLDLKYQARKQHEWDEFKRVVKLLQFVSGGFPKYFCFHWQTDKRKFDPGPGVTEELVTKETGLTWKLPEGVSLVQRDIRKEWIKEYKLKPKKKN